MGRNAKNKKQPAGASPSAATPKKHANAGDQTAAHPTSPEAEKNEAESEARTIPVMQTPSKPQIPPQTPRKKRPTPHRMPSEATAAASEENRAAPSSLADEPASLPSPLPSDTDSETPPGSPGLSSPDEAAAEAVISLYALPDSIGDKHTRSIRICVWGARSRLFAECFAVVEKSAKTPH